jgi:hypothetical protein
MKRINEERILRVWSLIIYKKGQSKYKKGLPQLRFISGSIKDPKGLLKVGEYNRHKNSVSIWWEKHTNSRDITSTLLHEYTHYLQFWPWYIRYSNTHQYKENPYEIEATKSERDTKYYIEQTSDKNWYPLIYKKRDLAQIYRKILSAVSV